MNEQNKYFCGICGWVDIRLFPNCHETQTSFTAVDSCEQEAARMIAQGVQGVRVENGVIFYQEQEEEEEYEMSDEEWEHSQELLTERYVIDHN